MEIPFWPTAGSRPAPTEAWRRFVAGMIPFDNCAAGGPPGAEPSGLGRKMPEFEWTAPDDFGRSRRDQEAPVFIEFWTTWTTWTTSFYGIEKNMLCNRRLMRSEHNNDPGQPCLQSANRARGETSGNGRRTAPSSAYCYRGA